MIDNAPTVRKRRICYINSDTKTFEASIAFFEKRLTNITNLEISQYSSLEFAKNSGPCDLLIFNSTHLSDLDFAQWFSKILPKIPAQHNIPAPTVFVSTLDFQSLEKIWENAYKNNWYFDIVHPDHMESLPIRIATLLRIHDHLHEVRRYEEDLTKMKQRMLFLEQRLEKKRNEPH